MQDYTPPSLANMGQPSSPSEDLVLVAIRRTYTLAESRLQEIASLTQHCNELKAALHTSKQDLVLAKEEKKKQHDALDCLLKDLDALEAQLKSQLEWTRERDAFQEKYRS